MSQVLAAAFFDQPTLVAIRLTKDAAADPVVRFATTPRRPAPAQQGDGCLTATLVSLGIGAVILVGVGAVSMCHSASSPSVTQLAPSYAAPPPAPPPIRVSHASDVDCDGGTTWSITLSTLDAVLEPKQTAWKPWFTRTLLRVPQTNPASWQTPRVNDGDKRTRDAALALAEAFAAVDSGPETAIVLDLPGPESVAAAGALSDRFEPVFTFDNIPDGAGVSPAQDTLGAVIYWLPRFKRAAIARGDKAYAPVFVLDAGRLNPYKNEADRFDNRYRAKLPDADALKQAGVKHVLYVRPTAGAITDSDDLNPLLVEWQKAGLSVKALGLSAFEPAAPAQEAPSATSGAPTTTTPQTTTVYHEYHYYNHSNWVPYFWSNYGWYNRPSWGTPSYAYTPSPDSAWAPSQRMSMFSGSTIPPPPGGNQRPRYVPPAPSYSSQSSSSPSFSSGSSSGFSSSSSGGSWGRSSGGSSFS